jgi:hypothetical protein
LIPAYTPDARKPRGESRCRSGMLDPFSFPEALASRSARRTVSECYLHVQREGLRQDAKSAKRPRN